MIELPDLAVSAALEVSNIAEGGFAGARGARSA
jgi:hypothetical protein